MWRTTTMLADMHSLSLLVLLVAAASAVDIVNKDGKISFHCSLSHSDHSVILKERKFPIYECTSDVGDRMIFASETFHDDKLDAVVDKETVLKLRDHTVVTRPKRQFGAGFGGSQASSYAMGGGFGGGGGFGQPGYYGGGPGFGAGGGFGAAGSQASSFGGGGGFGK